MLLYKPIRREEVGSAHSASSCALTIMDDDEIAAFQAAEHTSNNDIWGQSAMMDDELDELENMLGMLAVRACSSGH